MAKLIDLTNKKFDKLLVLEKAESRNRHTYWKCQCDCGNICEVSSEFLKRDKSNRDCGCSKKKNIHKKEIEEKKNHLIGKRFGRLVVLSPTKERQNNSIVWNCQCDCGNFKLIPTHLLTSGHTQSCGCLKLESHLIDITGQKFGKLLVLKREANIGTKWVCQCDCGNIKIIEGYNLRSGFTQSCGCINYSIGEQNIKKILDENNISYIKEYTCSDLDKKRFDFAILQNNQIIRLIEFDGEQHYTDKRGFWGEKSDSLKEVQQRDKEKNEYALSHNIPLVRIPYWERNNISLELIMSDKYLVKEAPYEST